MKAKYYDLRNLRRMALVATISFLLGGCQAGGAFVAGMVQEDNSVRLIDRQGNVTGYMTGGTGL